MPAFTASAPGKIILFGEHAVVYGEPALAVPLLSLRARATVTAQLAGKAGEVWIEAADIGLSSWLSDLAGDHPLRAAVAAAAGPEDLGRIPACRIQITSDLPSSSGLGSSAAVSAALIRAISAFLGKRLTDGELSDLTFEVEKLQHGTPSGIDNSVVAYQQPVYFQKGSPIEFLPIGSPFEILAVDSGKPGNTREAVEAVRERYLADPKSIGGILSQIGAIARQARDLILAGEPASLGPLMNENQALLRELGVSTPALDQLAASALLAGARGAKLSGGGLGGHLIVLPGSELAPVEDALRKAGAGNLALVRLGG